MYQASFSWMENLLFGWNFGVVVVVKRFGCGGVGWIFRKCGDMRLTYWEFDISRFFVSGIS